MNYVRRVADQRQTIADEAARDGVVELVGARRRLHLDLAELEAEAPLELGMEILGRQRHQTLRLRHRLGPHDRALPARERQDGERAARKEMLLRAALVIALVAYCGDDTRPAIGPPHHGDVGGGPDVRTAAVGGDE